MSLLIDAATKHQAGELAEAAKLYNEYIEKNAESVEALSLFGLCMQGMGNHRHAETLFSKALSADNTRYELYQNRGTTRLQMGKLVEALSDFESGLSISPNDIDGLKNAGAICIKLNKFDRAVLFFKRAFKLHSDENVIAGLAYCLSMRALQAIKEKKFSSAIRDLNEAYKLCPDSWEIAYNLGNAHLKSGNYLLARRGYEDARKLNRHSLDLHCNLGITYERLGFFSDSLKSYNSALQIDYDNHQARYNKSLLLLKLGQYQEGFELYEHRWRTKEFATIKRRFRATLWRGESNLSGKTILCHAEQGLGDTIQFIWFCSMFDTSKTRVLIQCQSSLIEIAKSMGLNAEFFSMDEELPSFDFHCPLMSLPFAFQYQPDKNKPRAKYLFSPKKKTAQWDSYLVSEGKPRIGLVLEGKASHTHNHFRSVNAADLINKLPKNVDYFLLQKELSLQTKELIKNRSDIKDLSGKLIDFSDTAAACVNMDLIITVDTAVAHLAGALGCPTNVLLHYQSDWRWGLETKMSHWYSKMNLIRLKRNGQWPDIYEEITASIESML